MGGSTKLMSSGAGGVILTTPGSIASDVTINMPTAGVNGGTLVCSDSSGNVGIGTSSTGYARLTVRSGTGTAHTILGNDYGSLYLETASGGPNRITSLNSALNASQAIAFNGAGGAEWMRIDSSGNLLVGTTGTISGSAATLQSSKSNAPALALQRTTTNAEIAVFYRDATNVGNISVTTSATAYNTSSDYRLKENIQPMQNALSVVAQLNPVTYTWKADGSDGQGFIAHELQAVVPDCVTGEKDAVDAEGKPVYQGIDTSFLVATLTKAIQEQQAQIETLTAKVAALEAK